MANTTTQEKKKRSLLNTTAGSDPITTIAKTEEGKRQAKILAQGQSTERVKAPSIGGGLTPDVATPDKFSGITTSKFAQDTSEELLKRQELRGVRQQMQIIGDGGRQARQPVSGEVPLVTQQAQEGAQRLTEEIAQPTTDLTDIAESNRLAEAGVSPILSTLNGINALISAAIGKESEVITEEDFASSAFGKTLGYASIGFAGAAAIAGGYFLGGAIATKVVTQSAIGATGTLGKGLGAALKFGGVAAAGLGIYKVTNLERGDINTAKAIVTKMVELGEREEATVKNGADAQIILNELQVMEGEVAWAESVLYEKGMINIEYKYSQEYMQDIAAIKGARVAIRRRYLAVGNIVQTGASTLDPQALVVNAAEIQKIEQEAKSL